MPTTARLERRQGAFAMRLASVQHGPHREIINGRTTLGGRLRDTLGLVASIRAIERTRTSQGQVLPGEICLAPMTRGEEVKERRTEEAVGEAQKYDRSPGTLWADGSRLDFGGVGGVVAWYEEAPHHGPPLPSLRFDRRGIVGLGARSDMTTHLPGPTDILLRGRVRVEEHRIQDEPRLGGLQRRAYGSCLWPPPPRAPRRGGAGLHPFYRLPGRDEEDSRRRPQAGTGNSSGGHQACSAAKGPWQHHHSQVDPSPPGGGLK